MADAPTGNRSAQPPGPPSGRRARTDNPAQLTLFDLLYAAPGPAGGDVDDSAPSALGQGDGHDSGSVGSRDDNAVGQAREDSSPAQAPQEQDPAPTAPGQNAVAILQDAGERIGGARKDLWAARGLTLADLEGFTPAEESRHVTKENIWPRPDWQALVEGGLNPTVAALRKGIYDGLAARPKSDTPVERRHFLTMIGLVRKNVEEAATQDALTRVRGVIQESVKLGSGTTREERAASERVYFSVFRRNDRALIVGPHEIAKAQKLADSGWPAPKPPWSRRFQLHEATSGVWFVTAPRSRVILADNFPDEAAATAWAEAASLRTAAGPSVPHRPHLDSLTRRGRDIRNGEDVGSEAFIEAFGFRAVEFGNWLAGDERQKSVNHAYDAFHDLADVLGVPPQALSLGGTLAIAFGSRGNGHASAHYEPDRRVINLTKIRGAGCLAHEFMHALDQYFGEVDNPTPTQGAPLYISERRGAVSGRYGLPGRQFDPTTRTHLPAPWMAHLRPEVSIAWAEVLNALHSRLRTPAEQLKARRIELRNAEHRLEQARRGVAESSERLASPGLRGAQRRKLEVELEESRATAVQQASRAESLADAITRLSRGESPVEPDQTRIETAYLKEARALSGRSGDYYLRETEMLARAFEAFVFDALAAAEVASEYLVHGVEAERFADKSVYRGNPYPAGEERVLIAAAFGRLFAAMETRTNVDGSIGLFKRLSAGDLPSGSDPRAPAPPEGPLSGLVLPREFTVESGPRCVGPYRLTRLSADVVGVEILSDRALTDRQEAWAAISALKERLVPDAWVSLYDTLYEVADGRLATTALGAVFPDQLAPDRLAIAVASTDNPSLHQSIAHESFHWLSLTGRITEDERNALRQDPAFAHLARDVVALYRHEAGVLHNEEVAAAAFEWVAGAVGGDRLSDEMGGLEPADAGGDGALPGSRRPAPGLAQLGSAARQAFDTIWGGEAAARPPDPTYLRAYLHALDAVEEAGMPPRNAGGVAVWGVPFADRVSLDAKFHSVARPGRVYAYRGTPQPLPEILASVAAEHGTTVSAEVMGALDRVEVVASAPKDVRQPTGNAAIGSGDGENPMARRATAVLGQITQLPGGIGRLISLRRPDGAPVPASRGTASGWQSLVGSMEWRPIGAARAAVQRDLRDAVAAARADAHAHAQRGETTAAEAARAAQADAESQLALLGETEVLDMALRGHDEALHAVPSDDRFLIWGSPLSAQTPAVKDALRAVGFGPPASVADWVAGSAPTLGRTVWHDGSAGVIVQGAAWQAFVAGEDLGQHESFDAALTAVGAHRDALMSWTGERLYRAFADRFSPRAASAILSRTGIEGIAFDDVGQERSYVAFLEPELDLPAVLQRVAAAAGPRADGRPGPLFAMVRPSSIAIDAATFQFKSGGDAYGVTDRLLGARWNPDLADPVLLWQARDETRFAADGHQRTGLAQREEEVRPDLEIAAWVYREIDGYSAAYMRVLAAYKNIAQGNATSLDAARIFREASAAGLTGFVPDLPPNSAIVRDGKALSMLSDRAFGMVANGLVAPGYAAVVGREIVDPDQQVAALAVLANALPGSLRQAELVVRQITAAGYSPLGESAQGDLFGDALTVSSLYGLRAQVIEEMTRHFAAGKRAFSTALGNAQTLEAAGNLLNHDANQEGVTTNEHCIRALDGAIWHGPVSDLVTSIAVRIANGDPPKRAVIAGCGRLEALIRSGLPGGATTWARGGDNSTTLMPGGFGGQHSEALPLFRQAADLAGHDQDGGLAAEAGRPAEPFVLGTEVAGRVQGWPAASNHVPPDWLGVQLPQDLQRGRSYAMGPLYLTRLSARAIGVIDTTPRASALRAAWESRFDALLDRISPDVDLAVFDAILAVGDDGRIYARYHGYSVAGAPDEDWSMIAIDVRGPHPTATLVHEVFHDHVRNGRVSDVEFRSIAADPALTIVGEYVSERYPSLKGSALAEESIAWAFSGSAEVARWLTTAAAAIDAAHRERWSNNAVGSSGHSTADTDVPETVTAPYKLTTSGLAFLPATRHLFRSILAGDVAARPRGTDTLLLIDLAATSTATLPPATEAMTKPPEDRPPPPPQPDREREAADMGLARPIKDLPAATSDHADTQPEAPAPRGTGLSGPAPPPDLRRCVDGALNGLPLSRVWHAVEAALHAATLEAAAARLPGARDALRAAEERDRSAARELARALEQIADSFETIYRQPEAALRQLRAALAEHPAADVKALIETKPAYFSALRGGAILSQARAAAYEGLKSVGALVTALATAEVAQRSAGVDLARAREEMRSAPMRQAEAAEVALRQTSSDYGRSLPLSSPPVFAKDQNSRGAVSADEPPLSTRLIWRAALDLQAMQYSDLQSAAQSVPREISDLASAWIRRQSRVTRLEVAAARAETFQEHLTLYHRSRHVGARLLGEAATIEQSGQVPDVFTNAQIAFNFERCVAVTRQTATHLLAAGRTDPGIFRHLLAEALLPELELAARGEQPPPPPIMDNAPPRSTPDEHRDPPGRSPNDPEPDMG